MHPQANTLNIRTHRGVFILWCRDTVGRPDDDPFTDGGAMLNVDAPFLAAIICWMPGGFGAQFGFPWFGIGRPDKLVTLPPFVVSKDDGTTEPSDWNNVDRFGVAADVIVSPLSPPPNIFGLDCFGAGGGGGGGATIIPFDFELIAFYINSEKQTL